MAIEFVRIDDRLIHGQVVTTWVKEYEIEQILIINDIIAQDEIQKNVFKMMAPQGVKIQTFGVEQFADIVKNNPIKRRTMILCTVPKDVLTLIQSGVAIGSLNIGGMKFAEGRKQLTKAVSVTEEEIENIKEILAAGIDVYVQMVPSDGKQDIRNMI